MIDYLKKLLVAFELHSGQQIEECFQNGIDPNQTYEDKPLFHALVNMYSRGPAFKNCVKVLLDYGLELKDEALLSILLDDPARLESHLENNPQSIKNLYTFDCAFTPLYQVSLLHMCAEYNHVETARVLVKNGIDVNTRAGMDDHGFGGQTPIFHTVNQDANKSLDMMKFLIAQGADLELTVRGLIWGKGYSWETFVPSVNPISYAMMGLLRQFQRTEEQIYEVVKQLMKHRYGIDYQPANVPNKYLAS
jgi:ankyrin repeat protein